MLINIAIQTKPWNGIQREFVFLFLVVDPPVTLFMGFDKHESKSFDNFMEYIKNKTIKM